MWLCVSVNSSFLFITEYNFVIQIYQHLFIHSPADGHLSCFQFSAIASKAAMNILVTFLYVWHMFSCPLGKTPRNGMKHLLNVCLTYTFYLPYVLIHLSHFLSLCTTLYIISLDLSPSALILPPMVSTQLLILYTKFSFQYFYFHL